MEPHIEKLFQNQNYRRSYVIFYCIIDKIIKNKNFLSFANLTRLMEDDLINILGGKYPLLNDRYCNLMETIKIIVDKKEIFYKELFSIKSDEVLLNYIVDNFPSFNDISCYKEKIIYFYIRATLLVRDLYEVSPIIRKNI